MKGSGLITALVFLVISCFLFYHYVTPPTNPLLIFSVMAIAIETYTIGYIVGSVPLEQEEASD